MFTLEPCSRMYNICSYVIVKDKFSEIKPNNFQKLHKLKHRDEIGILNNTNIYILNRYENVARPKEINYLRTLRIVKYSLYIPITKR